MATGNGFDKKEFQRQMEQLEEQFSGMGHDKDKQEQDKHQKPPEQEQIKRNLSETTFETYHDIMMLGHTEFMNLDTVS